MPFACFIFEILLKKGLISIEHIPSRNQLLADIFTKPLLPHHQFRHLRDQIMGWDTDPITECEDYEYTPQLSALINLGTPAIFSRNHCAFTCSSILFHGGNQIYLGSRSNSGPVPSSTFDPIPNDRLH